VTRPRLLLLDEPFAALDPELRDDMRLLVRRLQREQGVTTILVTHDQQEASMMADRIALLINGHLQQVGPPESFYTSLANLAVARFFGAQNFLPGTLGQDQHTVTTAIGLLSICHTGVNPGPVTLIIRPEHVRMEPVNAPGDGLIGCIRGRQFLGGSHRYCMTIGSTELSALTTTARYGIGDQVRVVLPAEHLWALPDSR